MLQMLLDGIRGMGRLFTGERGSAGTVRDSVSPIACRRCWSVISYMSALLTFCMAPTGTLFAQVVNVTKIINYSQTSATDVAQSPMYSFCVDVDGLSSTSTPPTFSGPVNVAAVASWYNNGRLVWNANDRCIPALAGWGAGTIGNDWGSSTLTDLNSKFGSGTYTVVVNGASYSLGLTGDAYPNPPLLTLSGGAWSNGKYVINPGSPLTITSNAFTAYGSHRDDRVGLGAISSDFGTAIAGTSQYYSVVPGNNYVTYTLPALTFVGGRNYFVGVQFTAMVDLQGNLNSASYGAASYTTNTLMSISADSSAPLMVALTVIKAGTGSGTVTSSPTGINCGSTCRTTVNSGTSVTLTATPTSGSSFAGWNGDCTGTGTCALSINAATNVTATFNIPPPIVVNPVQPVAPPPATQSAYTVTTGQMPTAAVTTTATGTLGNATVTVTLDLSKVLSGGSFAEQGQFAAGYNIYVVALVPSGVLGLPSATFFMLPATGAWAVLGSPIAAYMTGLAQNATNSVVITVLQGTDVTALVGTELYVGYGTSDTEMLAVGRYRGVYKVQ